jgi:nucleotide-binding universal stress UspA family protein
VSVRRRVGWTAAALADACVADVSLVVLGSGDHDAGFLSTAAAVSHRVGCPTVVVPAERHRGAVVVGIDGSGPGHAALGFAVREARRTAERLVVVHCRPRPSTWVSDGVPVAALDEEFWQSTGKEVLARALDEVGRLAPDAVVEGRLCATGAEGTLASCEGEASLVVVGTPRHGALTGLLTGSTSRALLRHPLCPVAVVPAH